MFTIEELEIIKSALEGDIIFQKKQLENVDINHEKRRKFIFEKWLLDTQKLHKKVAIELINRKAKREISNWK